MGISAKEVMELRTKTGAGMMDCKEALRECESDLDKAVLFLREKGLSSLSKRSDRSANEGIVDAYIHFNGKVGVLIEIDCETDFVAKSCDFKDFAKNVAMHIAAADPHCISREELPAEMVETERGIFAQQAADEGKPANIVEKIVEGRIEKFCAERCLLEQPYVKDDSMKVGDLLSELAAKIGENIVIKRFARFAIGAEG